MTSENQGPLTAPDDSGSLTKSVDAQQAKAMCEPLYADRVLPTGESVIAHADGVVEILTGVRPDSDLLAAAYLFYVPNCVTNSDEWIEKAFGEKTNTLVQELGRLDRLSQRARSEDKEANAQYQAEAFRKLLLAMCNDLRVVLLKLASRLQTLRYFAQKMREGEDAPLAQPFGRETNAIYAPLANRLGIWQMKWELEDLSFRFTHPKDYHEIAQKLAASREERLDLMATAVNHIQTLVAEHGIDASVSGRPKHIYSIWKKMERKHLTFEQLFDVRAIRVIVGSLEECYEVLSIIHEHYTILSKEYDDYIAKPKPNGYQSLHTVITDDKGRPFEIQIRTQQMHDFAELGVAAHWRYKEAGNSNGVSSADEQRVAWLRQLLAWSDDVKPQEGNVEDDRIYCLTPQGRVVELPRGGTPVDFAYMVHTQLGHRMKGAKVNGVMVPLNTPLQTGQTVEIIAGKTGQPSRDWLMPDLGFTASPRTRNKVRQWFNAQLTAEMIAVGRERLDKELARLGKTSIKLEELAKRLGFDKVDELYIAWAREEISVTALATAVQPPKVEEEARDEEFVRDARHKQGKGEVLVVGVGDLLTQLARCCHPVPPDEIVGYVTRGRGVSIHRADCPNVRNMANTEQERLIAVSWGEQDEKSVYPVDIVIVASERPGLLKDISEILLREKQNLVGMQSQRRRTDVLYRCTIEIPNQESLRRALQALRELKGVLIARRA